MKNLSINLLKLFLVWAITVFLVASCGRSAYANQVHPHGELALTGYNINGAYSPLRTFFMRNISMRPHRYVELGRDTFECAGFRLYQSVNPFRLHTNHLTVVCEAPNLINGAH